MVQGLRVWGLVAVEVKVAAAVEVWARAGVEWADHLLQGRVETVCARTVALMFRTRWVSRATR